MDAESSSILEKIQSDKKLCLKFDFIRKIGSGCFGIVYEAINRKNNKKIAIKLEVVDRTGEKPKSSSLLNEITIL